MFSDASTAAFLRPFCLKRGPIYLDCIELLIDESAEKIILYEKDAKRILKEFFENLKFENDDNDTEDVITNSKTPTENATDVITYFRKVGWLEAKEVGRNGDYTAKITPKCIRLFEALRGVFSPGKHAVLTNHIFEMYDILSAVEKEDSPRKFYPYSNILGAALDSANRLQSELIVLNENVRIIIKNFQPLLEVNEISSSLIRDDFFKQFIRDYFLIKKDGVIPDYINRIHGILIKLPETPIYKSMIQEYSKIEVIDEFSAEEKIIQLIDSLIYFITNSYEKEMSKIEAQINEYFAVYRSKLLRYTSKNWGLIGDISNLLDYLKKCDVNEKYDVLSSMSECLDILNFKRIDTESITRRKCTKREHKPKPLAKSTMTDKERVDRMNQIANKSKERYSIRNVSKYLDSKITSNKNYSLSDMEVSSRDDMLMLISSQIYSGSPDFKYQVKLCDDVYFSEIVRARNFIIRRNDDGTGI